MTMYYFGKIVGYIISPFSIALMGLLICILLKWRGWRHWKLVGLFSICWLWAWSTFFMVRMVGAPLESGYLINNRAPKAEMLPQADVIFLLGGGMWRSTNISGIGEMMSSADRVWCAARLFNHGKARKLLVTGNGVEASTWPLLRDFGVPREAVIFDERPRNTEEEAKIVSEYRYESVLVVTSAWHMKRTLLMFEKYASDVKAMPAAVDFENSMVATKGAALSDFMPSATALSMNSVAFHEWLGYLLHKIF